jgi:hypothetical protein
MYAETYPRSSSEQYKLKVRILVKNRQCLRVNSTAGPDKSRAASRSSSPLPLFTMVVRFVEARSVHLVVNVEVGSFLLDKRDIISPKCPDQVSKLSWEREEHAVLLNFEWGGRFRGSLGAAQGLEETVLHLLYEPVL